MLNTQVDVVGFFLAPFPLWVALLIVVVAVWLVFAFALDFLFTFHDMKNELHRIADALDKKVQGDIVREIK
jgi:hypothetical protein